MLKFVSLRSRVKKISDGSKILATIFTSPLVRFNLADKQAGNRPENCHIIDG
jgi:hypothetical protein